VSWVEVFAVFVVCHLVGDYLLQTDWQATNKRGGLFGNGGESRRALFRHILSYTLAFVPALVWLAAEEVSALGALGLGALIAVPHLIQDDGRLLTSYVANVKGCTAAATREVFTAVDQTFHLVALFGTALLATA
jgi:Protein of unknown function (DUF3307)